MIFIPPFIQPNIIRYKPVMGGNHTSVTIDYGNKKYRIKPVLIAGHMWWAISVKKFWGWHKLDDYCMEKDDAEKLLEQILNADNMTIYYEPQKIKT